MSDAPQARGAPVEVGASPSHASTSYSITGVHKSATQTVEDLARAIIQAMHGSSLVLATHEALQSGNPRTTGNPGVPSNSFASTAQDLVSMHRIGRESARAMVKYTSSIVDIAMSARMRQIGAFWRGCRTCVYA
eukprot:6182643-Pleurochrysis_carterae.AAC.2